MTIPRKEADFRLYTFVDNRENRRHSRWNQEMFHVPTLLVARMLVDQGWRETPSHSMIRVPEPWQNQPKGIPMQVISDLFPPEQRFPSEKVNGLGAGSYLGVEWLERRRGTHQTWLISPKLRELARLEDLSGLARLAGLQHEILLEDLESAERSLRLLKC